MSFMAAVKLGLKIYSVAKHVPGVVSKIKDLIDEAKDGNSKDKGKSSKAESGKSSNGVDSLHSGDVLPGGNDY
jgi:hypothetical protein